MDARAKMVRDILHAADQYLVPFFQRHYAWTQKHWERLYNDVLALQDDDIQIQHFLGPLVCTPSKHVPGEVTPYQLIDGQQRLCTLMVMLAALRDLARMREQRELAEEIGEDYLIHKRQKGSQRYKVLPRLGDREAFFAVVEGTKTDEFEDYNIVKAWKYFRDNFSGYVLDSPETKLRSLFNTITSRLSLVVITIDGENPYEIFESLNSTGLPLEESDLIRNFLFMQVPLVNQEEFHLAHWQPFEKMFEASGKDDELSQTPFYRSYLMRNGAYSKEKSTFQDFKLHNKEINLSPVEQIEELKRFAEFEVWLRRPHTCPNAALAKALAQIQELEITTAHPLFFHLLDRHKSKLLSDDDLLACLRDLESFVLRRSICGETSRTYARWFPESIKSIKSNTRFDLQSYWLRRGWPDDESFVNRLVEFSIYRRENAKCRLILEALEESYGHREKVHLPDLEIEHLMPQTIGSGKHGKEWKLMLGDQWEGLQEKWLHTLGNLTLTGYNRPLSNKSFKEKKTELSRSNLILNDYFADKQSWREQEIKARSLKLGKEVCAIWQRPHEGPAYVPSSEPDLDGLNAEGRRQLRADYWTEMLKVVAAQNFVEVLPEPTNLGFITFHFQWRGATLFAYMETWEKIVGVYIRFNKPYAKESLKTLEEKKKEITEHFGEELRWTEDRKKKKVYITLSLTGVDPLNRGQWPDQHKWLAEKLAEFHRFFSPMIQSRIAKAQKMPLLDVSAAMSGKKVPVHFAGKERFLPLFGDLLEQLRGMNIPFQINPEPRHYIALVGEEKAFAWVHPKLQWIRIDLRLSSVEAAESGYTSWSEKDDGGYYHLETINQVPIVAKLIEKAYQKSRQ